MDAVALEPLGGLDAFPGAGDLYEDAFAPDAGRVVEIDQTARLAFGRCGIEAEPRIDLR